MRSGIVAMRRSTDIHAETEPSDGRSPAAAVQGAKRVSCVGLMEGGEMEGSAETGACAIEVAGAQAEAAD